MRRSARLTQAEVAAHLQLDRSYYSRMERGERPIDVELAEKVAILCGFRTLVVEPAHDRAATAIAALNSADLDLILRLAALLPTLHPLRRADFLLQLGSWEHSSLSEDAEMPARSVKKL